MENPDIQQVYSMVKKVSARQSEILKEADKLDLPYVQMTAIINAIQENNLVLCRLLVLAKGNT